MDFLNYTIPFDSNSRASLKTKYDYIIKKTRQPPKLYSENSYSPESGNDLIVCLFFFYCFFDLPTPADVLSGTL